MKNLNFVAGMTRRFVAAFAVGNPSAIEGVELCFYTLRHCKLGA